ncbi:MAG: PHP domain-containing protein [Clostridia bacterium]|nr:PHP domain-containing protein [Clostridia bacterium]
MRRPDLHLHTSASDGKYPVTDVARLVQRANVTLFAITDHDTMAALPEAADAAYERGLAFLPGVEISAAADESNVHILGYGVDPCDPVLAAFFERMSADRIRRIAQMGEKLAELGMPLPMDEIFSGAGSSIGRPHLARAMVKCGYARDTGEAFQLHLKRGRPAYVKRNLPSAAEAIQLLRERGAVPVVAHPGEIRLPKERLLSLLDEWERHGLMGLEVYHPANRGNYPEWDRLARQRGLLVTGGSDFHGDGANHGSIGETASEWPAALTDAWKLFRAVNTK